MFSRFAVIMLVLGIAALATIPGTAESAGKAWTLKPSMQAKVTEFRENAPEVFDMRIYGVPNDLVFLKRDEKEPLLPIYDMLACIKLSNPDGNLDVDSGGGYDIAIDRVTFPKGTWSVDLRILEIKKIKLNEEVPVYILDRVNIGLLAITEDAVKLQTLRTMTRACLN